MSARTTNANQSRTYPVNVIWGADELPRQPLSPGMEWSERAGSTDTTRLEGERSVNSGILDLYASSSRTAVSIGEFYDEHGACDSEQQQEQTYALDPTAIFKKATETEIKKLAPEQNITLFALRLALIEKSASGIGTLSFIWASTIILGGFASNINPVDFIVIALILVTEGTRIFSRSGELEWQHLASKSTDTSSSHQSERLTVGEKCGSRDLTNYGRSTVATQELPIPSSEPPGPTLATPAKFLFRSPAYTSQEDLESGLSIADKKLQRSPYLPPTGNPPSEKKRKELDEIENIIEVESGHGMNRQPSRSAFHNVSRWNSTQYKDKPDKEKFPKNVLGRVDAKNTKRTWSSELVPILPGWFNSILSTRGVSANLYWIQLTLAIICLVLSCWRLLQQEYNPPAVLKKDTPVNLYTSLNIFYTLALTEALLFLLERAYWEYKINCEQLVVHVSNRADLGVENQEMMKQFFYEVYKKCIDGSVFDGLAMDIVEYSLSLLQSDNSFEQLGGLRVLRKIVDRYDGFSLDALRRIGAAPGVIDRLVEMLSWRGTHQGEIRGEVAALICRLARYSNLNSFRLAAVPGAMEGIVSLLRPHDKDHFDKSTDLLSSERTIALRLDGLRILVAQARDPVNLLKIGETRSLVPILATLIAVTDVHAFRTMEGSELKTFKKVLRLLKMLAAARNTTGTILRPVIVRVVFGVASMRDILEFGDCHPKLQWMAIEILNNLTLEDDIRRAIGSTGGVIQNLFTLYRRNVDWSKTLSETDKKAEKAVSKRAGDALNLLATMCRKNCLRMMDLQDENGKKTFIPALLSLLNENREQTVCAAKILRSLLEFGSYSQKREIAVCIVRVMRLVKGSSSQRMHEAVVGLAPRVLAVLDRSTYEQALEDVDRTELVQRLLRNLEYNAHGSSRFPRIRRHSIELIMTLMNRDPIFVDEFMKGGLLERNLMQTLDSIWEYEDYVIFSDAEGLIKHSITMEDLVQRALHEVRSLDRERANIPLETLELGSVQYHGVH